jgi:hypothetical protein
MYRIKGWTLEGTSLNKEEKIMCNVVDDFRESELSTIWMEIERR